MNIPLLVEMVSAAAADRIAIGSGTGRLATAELLSQVRRVATLFRELRVERVGFLGVNSEAVPLCLLGAACAGVPFAPLNYRLTDDQLGAVVARLAPCLLVAGPDERQRIPSIDGVEIMATEELLDGVRHGDSDVASAPASPLPDVDAEAIAVLLFTSGTTGEPKAAVLRHRHLASYVVDTVELMGAGEDEAQLVSVPPYHIAGISSALTGLYSGRRLVYLPAFDAETWVRTVADEAITHAMVVPTMLGRLLRAADETGADLSSLRHLSYGGGRMDVTVIERAMAQLAHVDFVNAYGLTETSSTISVLTPADHRDALASGYPAIRRRLGSVGRPVPSIELEIRGPGGEPVPAGVRGEVHVRGPQVAGEYLHRRVVTHDGWFPTNDAGHVDEHGFLYLDGRLDDVIVRGAENISPGEVEAVLLSHPGVSGAAVVGVPDPEWGEAVAAAIVLADGAVVTADELRDWTRRRLRSTKTPQLIEFRRDLPYNEMGKLLRRALRDELGAGPRQLDARG